MGCTLRDVANGGFRALGVATAILFIGLLIDFGVESYFARASKDWPSTVGTITKNTEIETTHRQYVTSRWGAGGGSYRTTTTFERQFQYRYVVDGNEFTGSRIAWVGYEFDEGLDIERLHGEVPVYYDPRQPSRSVVFPGVRYRPFPAVGLLLAGLGFGLVLAYCGVALVEWPFRLLGLKISR